MKPILVTAGEPAGIGPDIVLQLSSLKRPVVLLADINLLEERASLLGLDRKFRLYNPEASLGDLANTLTVWHLPTASPVVPGQVDKRNVAYVLATLDKAIDALLAKKFDALVTAPIHKAIINEAGIPFKGHTEYLAKRCQVEKVVMLLVSEAMKVALMTTHIPLAQVPGSLSEDLLIENITITANALEKDFGIIKPSIAVAGLNPHAGEGGHLGLEELQILKPAIARLKEAGFAIEGPFSADSLFRLEAYDVFISMYHDQGLPVIKYASFGEAVNVTLGLPIIRTSVDHGTALPLAGTGKASPSSLNKALALAEYMADNRYYGEN